MPAQHLSPSANCTEPRGNGKVKTHWQWKGIQAAEHMVSVYTLFLQNCRLLLEVNDPNITNSCPSNSLEWTSYQIKKGNSF